MQMVYTLTTKGAAEFGTLSIAAHQVALQVLSSDFVYVETIFGIGRFENVHNVLQMSLVVTRPRTIITFPCYPVQRRGLKTSVAWKPTCK